MKKIYLLILGLTILFFALRLANLGAIPIFTDEAIYLRWSQIMVNDASLRYLPLIDGKPPLFMWGTSMAMKLLPAVDPLLTGRMVAIVAGYFGMLGVMFTSWVLFKNKKVSLISALLYIFVPFTFFYDRFGLADSMLAMWGIWSLGLSVLLAQTLRLDVAMILGMVIGLGFLTKSPALFFLMFTPLSVVFLKFSRKNLVKFVGLLFVVLVLSQAIYSILRLFPLFNMIGQKNLEFAVPLSEFIKSPLKYFPGNFKSLISWEFIYLTPLVSLLAIWAGVRAVFKKSFGELIIAACFIGFTIAMSAGNKVIYPRFLLIFTPGLLILVALCLSKIKKYFWVALGLTLIIPVFTIISLIINPVTAPIPESDSYQYLNGWAAGFGVKEVRSFLTQHPNSTIITEGTFGLMPYSLDLYQKEYPSVKIESYWPLPEFKEIKITNPTYLIIYQHEAPPKEWKTKLIQQYQQGNSQSYLRLYQVFGPAT